MGLQNCVTAAASDMLTHNDNKRTFIGKGASLSADPDNWGKKIQILALIIEGADNYDHFT